MPRGRPQNTFHTLKDMRIVFVDGTVLDTSDAARRATNHHLGVPARGPRRAGALRA